MRIQQAVLSIVTLALGASVAFAQGGTEFTYQGRLLDAGAPANGAFNVDFSLWDDPAAGNQVGSTNTFNSLPILEGLFTVELDFGASAFDNNDRWLEITVDGVPLVPRQPITRAPYAIQTRGLFVDENGQVGIGTDTPEYALQVVTDTASRAVSGVNVGATGFVHGGYFSNSSTAGAGVFCEATAVSGNPFGGLFYSNAPDSTGVLGENHATSGTAFGVWGYTRSTRGEAVFGVADSFTGLNYGGRFWTFSPDGTGVQGWASAVTGTTVGVLGTVSSGQGYAGYFEGGRNYFEGNVGIGTYEPLHQLHLASLGSTTIFLEADTNNNGEGDQPQVLFSQDGGLITGGIGFFDSSNSLMIRTFDSGVGTPNILLQPEGNVGIGIATPEVRLQITGGSDVSLTGGGYIVNGSTGGLNLAMDDNEIMARQNGAAAALFLNKEGGDVILNGDNIGSVGIGLGSPSFQLEVNGSAGKPGGGSWSNSSDRRLKKNIHDLEGSLGTLLRLRGVTFEYKDPKIINELSGERIGFIAQEVEEVIPDWVDEGPNGYKRLTVRGFEALTVEALRELRAEKNREIEQLRLAHKSEMESLRAENEELQQRFAKLESIVLQLQAQNN